MSHKNLEIWKLSRDLVIDIHNMTFNELPKFELYKEGNQIRKSSKSFKSIIVENYRRKRYRQEYIRFLTYALASKDKTTDHLETLFETKSLINENIFLDLHERPDNLGKNKSL